MKNRYNWIIGLLVLLNIALLGTIWFNRGRPPHRDRQEVRKLVEHELQFSPEQSKQYDVLIKEHQHDIRAIKEEILPLKNELFDMVALPEDSVKTKIVSDKIAKLVVEQDLATLRHFRKVRNTICTEPQKKLLDKLLSEILAKINHQGGPPPPQGGRPD